MDTATKQTWGGEAHKLLSDELKVISDILILSPDSISITNTRGKVNYNSQAVLLAGLSVVRELLICTQSRDDKTYLHYLRQQFPSLVGFLRKHVVNQGVRKN